jgi:hypothetical protein
MSPLPRPRVLSNDFPIQAESVPPTAEWPRLPWHFEPGPQLWRLGLEAPEARAKPPAKLAGTISQNALMSQAISNLTAELGGSRAWRGLRVVPTQRAWHKRLAIDLEVPTVPREQADLLAGVMRAILPLDISNPQTLLWPHNGLALPALRMFYEAPDRARAEALRADCCYAMRVLSDAWKAAYGPSPEDALVDRTLSASGSEFWLLSRGRRDFDESALSSPAYSRPGLEAALATLVAEGLLEFYYAHGVAFWDTEAEIKRHHPHFDIKSAPRMIADGPARQTCRVGGPVDLFVPRTE